MINPFEKIKQSRIITKLNDEIIQKVRLEFSIAAEEKILCILDDSLLKDLMNIVVLTDKKIYWNIKNAYYKTTANNSESVTKGKSSASAKQFSTASVYIKKIGNEIFIYLIGEIIQLVIPFRYFTFGDPLKVTFYDYISNYSGGYNPNKSKNESVFLKYLKENKRREKISVSNIVDYFNYLIIIFLLLNMIFKIVPEYVPINYLNEKLIFITMILKILNIIAGSKKSVFINLLLILITANILLLPELIKIITKETIYIIYGFLLFIFSLIDFDRIFKFTIILLAIVSLILVYVEYFYNFL